MMNEALVYSSIARADFPDDYAETIEIFGRSGGAIAAEMAYIKLHDAIPNWALYIKAFEKVEDGYIFVHNDPLTN